MHRAKEYSKRGETAIPKASQAQEVIDHEILEGSSLSYRTCEIQLRLKSSSWNHLFARLERYHMF